MKDIVQFQKPRGFIDLSIIFMHLYRIRSIVQLSAVQQKGGFCKNSVLYVITQKSAIFGHSQSSIKFLYVKLFPNNNTSFSAGFIPQGKNFPFLDSVAAIRFQIFLAHRQIKISILR